MSDLLGLMLLYQPFRAPTIGGEGQPHANVAIIAQPKTTNPVQNARERPRLRMAHKSPIWQASAVGGSPRTQSPPRLRAARMNAARSTATTAMTIINRASV